MVAIGSEEQVGSVAEVKSGEKMESEERMRALLRSSLQAFYTAANPA